MLFLPNLAHCLLLKTRTVGSTSGKYLGVIEIPSTSQNAKLWPQIDCNGDDLFMARELKQEGRHSLVSPQLAPRFAPAYAVETQVRIWRLRVNFSEVRRLPKMKSTIGDGWTNLLAPRFVCLFVCLVCVCTRVCTGNFMHGHICGGRRTAFQELGLLPIYNVVSLVSAVTAYVYTQLILLSPLLSPYESARVMAVSHQI